MTPRTDTPPILFLPIINWEFRTQRPQQLARCFARAGNRVYYPLLHLCPEPPPPPRLVESGIWQIALRGDPGRDPYCDRLSAAAVEQALGSLRRISAEHSLEGCWIVTELPFWRPLAEAAKAAFGGALLFDCMDDFSSFGDHSDPEEDEAALAAAADLVTVTSQRLFDKLSPLNSHTRIVRNGCDPAHFGPAVARVLPRQPVVVGFFGGIHDWFDTDLVADLARLRPRWEIRLIGDTYRSDVEALRSLPNVALLGEVPYSELPRLVSCFHAGIIPFKISPLTEAADPIKAYEMLAAGLPVVAVDLPELRRLEPMIAVARGAADFAARIEKCLEEPPEARMRRLEIARRESWTDRFLLLRRAMDETPGETVRRPALRVERLCRSERFLGLGDLERENAALESERFSLIEQRDRVEAEALRLRCELDRVEAERCTLETELVRARVTFRQRLAGRGKALLGRLGL